MLKGPEEFGQGVMKGGKSFHDNVLRGMGESIHKASGALGHTLAELTQDRQYLEKRAAGETAVVRGQTSGPPKRNVAEGAVKGADTVVTSLFRGVTGLVQKPLEGAKEKGVEGFFKGLGMGAAGLIVKPVVGLTDAIGDAFEHTATDVRQSTGVFAQRLRLPRTLGHCGELSTFSRYDAEVQQQLWLVTQPGSGAGGKVKHPVAALRDIASGRFAAGRPCGGPGAVGSKRLVVTTKHVLSLQTGSGGASAGHAEGSRRAAEGDVALEWYEKLHNVATAEESAAEVVLHLRDGGMRFIHCAGGVRERRAVFEVVDRALRTLDLSSGVRR